MSKLRFMMIGRGQSIAVGSTDPEVPPTPSGLSVQTGTPPGYLVGAIQGLPSGATVTMERVDADDAAQKFVYHGGNIYTGLTATDSAVASSHNVTLTLDEDDVISTLTFSIAVVASGVIRKLPIAQSVSFGEKTLCGFGGHHLNYLGSTPLRIVSQVNSSAAAVTTWDIDAQNKLVISTIGSSYGATPPALTAGPYTVVVTDESVTTTVTISIEQYRYHIAPNAADTSSSAQLPLTLNKTTSGVVNWGDQIIWRPGIYFRPGGVQNTTDSPRFTCNKNVTFTQRGGGPGAPDAVSHLGWVTNRPEIPNTQTSYARFYLPTGSSKTFDLQFHELNFRCIGQDPAVAQASQWEQQGCVEGGGGLGNMLMFTKCRFFVDFFGTQTWHGSRTGRCAVILTQNWTSTHFLDNYFERFINGINYSPRGGGCKVVGNTFKETWNNCIMVMGIDDNGTGTHEICFNFAYDMRRAVVENAGDNTPHVDFFQVINGRSDGLDFNWGAIVVGNITTSAPKAVKGAQGLLTTPSSASTGNTVLWMNSWHYGNIYIDGYGQGWTSVNSENGTFKYNTILSPFDTYATDTPPNMGHLGAALARVTDYTCSKNIVGGGASIGRGTGEVSDNIVNLITPSNAGSSRTLVQTYYTATEFGDNLITKAEIIAQLTPKAPAAGYGAVGTGCDHIAQTCSMPDGFTYSRPYALIG